MTQPTNAIDAAMAKRDSSIQDARDQAAEFESFVASGVYTTPTGVEFPIHNLGTLDDDQQEAFNELQNKFLKCDKTPDVEAPGRKVTATDPDGTTVVTEYPPHIITGQPIQPYQTGGVLEKPSYAVQLVQALLGTKGYEEFKAAKGKSSVYSRAVMKQTDALAAREKADPKSKDGTSDLADVPD